MPIDGASQHWFEINMKIDLNNSFVLLRKRHGHRNSPKKKKHTQNVTRKSGPKTELFIVYHKRL